MLAKQLDFLEHFRVWFQENVLLEFFSLSVFLQKLFLNFIKCIDISSYSRGSGRTNQTHFSLKVSVVQQGFSIDTRSVPRHSHRLLYKLNGKHGTYIKHKHTVPYTTYTDLSEVFLFLLLNLSSEIYLWVTVRTWTDGFENYIQYWCELTGNSSFIVLRFISMTQSSYLHSSDMKKRRLSN